jgi:thiamine-monophosphate kinase
LDFIPRVEEGIFLRESGLVNAMMDVSDGLATDLRHILQCSGVGAVLDAENIPKVGTLEQALFDGEDFELLFTVSEENQKELLGRWRNQFPGDLSRVGTLVPAADGLCLQYADGKFQSLGKKGHEHFRVG